MPQLKASEGPGTLLEAILAVQAEVGPIAKDAINPAFKSKYTTLGTIVETVGPILNKHGLIWMTYPESENGQPVLRYSLVHAATKDMVGGVMPLLLTKQDPQGLGSALTYARRYSLCAVLNLVADDDDDGNAGSAPKQTAGALARAKASMNVEAQELLATAKGMREPAGVSEADFQRFADSTGYTENGLQRLVDYLKARLPNASDAS